MAVILLALTAAMLGAALQRVSGMGFALVAAPLLVLLLGPFDGVVVVNVGSMSIAALLTARSWRDIDWRRFALLGIPAVLLIPLGALFVVSLEAPALQVVIGAFLILALTVSLLVRRGGRRARVTPSGLIAGAVSGFLSVTAGTAGPPMSVFAVLTDWEQRRFAATMQPFFFTLALASVVAKASMDGGAWPDVHPLVWVALIGVTVLGAVGGEFLSRWVPVVVARRLVIFVAYLGSIAALAGGLAALLADV